MYVCMYERIYYVRTHGSDVTGFRDHDQVLLDGHRMYVCINVNIPANTYIHTLVIYLALSILFEDADEFCQCSNVSSKI